MFNVRREFRFMIPVVFVAAIMLAGVVVMFLWNIIIVPLLHVGVLGFWQALGLMLLCRILFGGFRGGAFAGNRGGPWKDKWRSMSEEERMQMKAAWRDRCRPRRQYPEESSGEGIKIPVTD